MKTTLYTRFPFKPLAILLAAFLLGTLVGSGLLVLKIKHSLQAAVRNSGPHPKVEKSFARLGNLLSKRLELTPAETSAVNQELQATVGKISQIRVELVQDLDRETQDTLQRIAAHIPAEKQNLLKQIAEKRLRPWGLLESGESEAALK